MLTSSLLQVGNRVDRFFYQSRAKDPETPESELFAFLLLGDSRLTSFYSATAFPAKLDGTSGHLIITFGPQTPPTLSFVPLKSPFEKPSFEKPVADLVEVKKRGVSQSFGSRDTSKADLLARRSSSRALCLAGPLPSTYKAWDSYVYLSGSLSLL